MQLTKREVLEIGFKDGSPYAKADNPYRLVNVAQVDESHGYIIIYFRPFSMDGGEEVTRTGKFKLTEVQFYGKVDALAEELMD